MKKTNLALVQKPDAAPSYEVPPSLNYELSFADGPALEEIISRMQAMRRQTMNLRVMSDDAKMICLRDLDKGNKIIGWAGMALRFNPKYPEIFSLTLMPEYQKYLLGLYLEYSRSLYVRSQGFEKVFMRITNDPNSEIRKKRLQQGFVTALDPATLDVDYRNLCLKCELYGKECSDRIFVQVNIAKIIEFAEYRLGPMENKFPNRIELDFSRIRKNPKKSAA